MPIVQLNSYIYLHWDFNTFMNIITHCGKVCPMLGFERKCVNKEYNIQYSTNIFIVRTDRLSASIIGRYIMYM